MDYNEKLDEVVEYLDAARSLPMSSSIIVNKKELTELLDQLRDALPEDLVAAQAVIRRRDAILGDATASAERLLEAAAEEQRRMVSESEIVQEARIEAGSTLRMAQDKAEQMSRDVDGYVDAKLAHLEVSVSHILDTVRQGRERLASPDLYAELAPQVDEPDPYVEPAPGMLEGPDEGLVAALPAAGAPDADDPLGDVGEPAEADDRVADWGGHADASPADVPPDVGESGGDDQWGDAAEVVEAQSRRE